MNISEIVERLDMLMTEHEISATKLTKELGLSVSTITDWRLGKSKNPSLDAIVKFATYFDVSIEWLVFGKEPEPLELSKKEQEFLSLYNSLPANLQDRTISYMAGMIAARS